MTAHLQDYEPKTCLHPRDVAEVKPWAETCGQIRPLIEEKDGAAAEVHHLEITDAKLHYHERTDEIYYVMGGRTHEPRWQGNRTVRRRYCLCATRSEAQGLGQSESAGRLHPSRRVE